MNALAAMASGAGCDHLDPALSCHGSGSFLGLSFSSWRLNHRFLMYMDGYALTSESVR